MAKVVKMTRHQDGTKVKVFDVELKKDKDWVNNLLNIIGDYKEWHSFDLIGEDYSIYILTKNGEQWFYYSDTYGKYYYADKSMKTIVTDVYKKRIEEDIWHKVKSGYLRLIRHEADYLALHVLRVFLTEQIAYGKEKEICNENKIHKIPYCGFDIEVEMCVGGNKEHVKFTVKGITLDVRLEFFQDGRPRRCFIDDWMGGYSLTHVS